MNNHAQKFADMAFGPTNENCCVMCKSDKTKPEDFVDDLSHKEWKISHMCQKCQNSVFGFDDEEEEDL